MLGAATFRTLQAEQGAADGDKGPADKEQNGLAGLATVSTAAIRDNRLAQTGLTSSNFDDLDFGVPLPVASATTGVLSPP